MSREHCRYNYNWEPKGRLLCRRLGKPNQCYCSSTYPHFLMLASKSVQAMSTSSQTGPGINLASTRARANRAFGARRNFSLRTFTGTGVRFCVQAIFFSPFRKLVAFFNGGAKCKTTSVTMNSAKINSGMIPALFTEASFPRIKNDSHHSGRSESASSVSPYWNTASQRVSMSAASDAILRTHL